MYLMDSVIQIAALMASRSVRAGLTQTGQRYFSMHDDPTAEWMRSYTDLADLLEGAPRFLLDANATRTAVELNLGRPKVTFEAMQHLRIPYPKLWVEWEDADRQKLREKFDEPLNYAELRPMPGRVGFLLEAEPGGRRGKATWAWTTPDTEHKIEGIDVPNVGAIQAFFDLDQQFTLPSERVAGLLKGNLAKLWLDNPVQLAALFDIWRTSEHRPGPHGASYFQALGNDPLAIALSFADVVGEYIMIWAVVLLLTASRPVVDLNAIDLRRLNKSRMRKGEFPLLDHTRVSLKLTPMEQRPVIRGELGYSRKSPRVHLVSRYLARRGSKHWIVEPYWRGSGETISRHIHVRG